MAVTTKSRTREFRMPAFVLKRYLGDHLQVGTLQDQDDRSSSQKYQETITYGTGSPFNELVGSKVIGDWDHGCHGTLGTIINDTWRLVGYKPTSSASARMPDCQLIYREGDRTKVYRPGATRTITMDPGAIELARMNAYNRLSHLAPKPHANWLRAVCELKDAKQTIEQATRFLTWSRSYFGRAFTVGSSIKIWIKDSTRISHVAKAYLWDQFGVEPTVADVRRFLNELSNGKLRVYGEMNKTKTLAKKGQVVVARYSVKLPGSSILDEMFGSGRHEDLGYGYVHLFPGYGTRTVTWPAQGIVPFQPSYGRPIKVTHEVSGCYFARAKNDISVTGLQDIKRSWEWNCPSFRTLWELTPFSFLVDWVVGVGDTIEALEKRYCTQNYLSQLGQVWRFEKDRTTTYRPIVSGQLEAKPVSPATDANNWGTCVISGEAKYGYYRGETTSAFTRRAIGEPPSVVWPVLTRKLKAYHVTTGMALLAQAAEAWRK